MQVIYHIAKQNSVVLCANVRNLKDIIKDDKEDKEYTEKEFFMVRLADKLFCGIQTDWTLESSLNKFLCAEGGPFRHGPTLPTIFKWISGTVYTQDIIEWMERFCKIFVNKHDNASDARIETDDNLVNNFVRSSATVLISLCGVVKQ